MRLAPLVSQLIPQKQRLKPMALTSLALIYTVSQLIPQKQRLKHLEGADLAGADLVCVTAYPTKAAAET